jgi:hypothetical protein
MMQRAGPGSEKSRDDGRGYYTIDFWRSLNDLKVTFHILGSTKMARRRRAIDTALADERQLTLNQLLEVQTNIEAEKKDREMLSDVPESMDPAVQASEDEILLDAEPL